MTDVVPNIWYSDVSNEIVDNNSTEESEFRENFNTAIDKAKELYHLECETLAENSLENLNKEQLSAFLMVNYFDWWVKTYSQCRETWKFLDFSMKAALQLLFKGDTTKYDDNWNPSENWRTMDDIIKSRWGMDLDSDTVLVKILQKKVGAHPDWKPGPQTIALVISALGGDISSIYDWVNSLARSEKYRIQNIAEFTINWLNYKYDQNQFSLTTVDWKIYLTLKWSSDWKEVVMKDWKPTLTWFTFENWWIKKLWAVSSSSETWLNDVYEAISCDVSVDQNGNLVDVSWENLNGKKTDFVSWLINSECRRQHRKEWKRSWYNISHSDCVRSMTSWKLTYSKETKKINYENWKIKFNISMSADNGQNIFTIDDNSYEYSGDISGLRFTNLSEAINTLKLIEYIKIRFDWVETWANTWNRDYNGWTDNDSPFFAADRALYFSSDHGSFWGAFWAYDDENIISIDNLKKISEVFRRNDNRVKFAQYLITAVGFEEEH